LRALRRLAQTVRGIFLDVQAALARIVVLIPVMRSASTSTPADPVRVS